MSTLDVSLRPSDFAEAAIAAIEDAQTKSTHEAAQLLAQAGLTNICVPEALDGLGLDISFAVPIARAAGKLRFQFPLVEQILLAKALAGTPYGARLASGEKLATIAFAGQLKQAWVGGARHADVSDWLLIFDGDAAVLVNQADVQMTQDPSFDPDHPQHWLQASKAPVLASIDSETCAVLLRDAKILMAALVNGAAEGALAETVTYLSSRVQFGRPLTAKQAVRHTFSRMKLLQEASVAAIHRVLSLNEFGHSRQINAVFASAIQHAVWVIERAIHLQGGMGFTWDVPLHDSLREVRKIEAAFDIANLTADIGREWIEVNA